MTITTTLKLISISTLISLGTAPLKAAISIDLGDIDNSIQYTDTEIATNHAGYTGSGFLAYNNSTGSGFTVEAPDDFTSITLRYAAASTTAGEYYVYIDDTASLQFSGTSIVFSKTGSWDTWTEVTLQLSGNEGDYFNLAFADDLDNRGGANFDYITFNVPEPASYALIFSAVALGAAGLRRRPR